MNELNHLRALMSWSKNHDFFVFAFQDIIYVYIPLKFMAWDLWSSPYDSWDLWDSPDHQGFPNLSCTMLASFHIEKIHCCRSYLRYMWL